MCSVRSVDKQITSSVPVPSVFRGSCHSLIRRSPLVAVVIDHESVAPEISSSEVIVAKELLESSHVPHMSNAVPVSKRGNTSTIAQSPKKHHMKTATVPETVVVKEKDLLNVTKAAELLHLSTEAVAALKTFLQAMKTAWCVYTKNVRSPCETLVLQSSEDL